MSFRVKKTKSSHKPNNEEKLFITKAELKSQIRLNLQLREEISNHRNSIIATFLLNKSIEITKQLFAFSALDEWAIVMQNFIQNKLTSSPTAVVELLQGKFSMAEINKDPEFQKKGEEFARRLISHIQYIDGNFDIKQLLKQEGRDITPDLFKHMGILSQNSIIRNFNNKNTIGYFSSAFILAGGLFYKKIGNKIAQSISFLDRKLGSQIKKIFKTTDFTQLQIENIPNTKEVEKNINLIANQNEKLYLFNQALLTLRLLMFAWIAYVNYMSKAILTAEEPEVSYIILAMAGFSLFTQELLGISNSIKQFANNIHIIQTLEYKRELFNEALEVYLKNKPDLFVNESLIGSHLVLIIKDSDDYPMGDSIKIITSCLEYQSINIEEQHQNTIIIAGNQSINPRKVEFIKTDIATAFKDLNIQYLLRNQVKKISDTISTPIEISKNYDEKGIPQFIFKLTISEKFLDLNLPSLLSEKFKGLKISEELKENNKKVLTIYGSVIAQLEHFEELLKQVREYRQHMVNQHKSYTSTSATSSPLSTHAYLKAQGITPAPNSSFKENFSTNKDVKLSTDVRLLPIEEYQITSNINETKTFKLSDNNVYCINSKLDYYAIPIGLCELTPNFLNIIINKQDRPFLSLTETGKPGIKILAEDIIAIKTISNSDRLLMLGIRVDEKYFFVPTQIIDHDKWKEYAKNKDHRELANLRAKVKDYLTITKIHDKLVTSHDSFAPITQVTRRSPYLPKITPT